MAPQGTKELLEITAVISSAECSVTTRSPRPMRVCMLEADLKRRLRDGRLGHTELGGSTEVVLHPRMAAATPTFADFGLHHDVTWGAGPAGVSHGVDDDAAAGAGPARVAIDDAAGTGPGPPTAGINEEAGGCTHVAVAGRRRRRRQTSQAAFAIAIATAITSEKCI